MALCFMLPKNFSSPGINFAPLWAILVSWRIHGIDLLSSETAIIYNDSSSQSVTSGPAAKHHLGIC